MALPLVEILITGLAAAIGALLSFFSGRARELLRAIFRKPRATSVVVKAGSRSVILTVPRDASRDAMDRVIQEAQAQLASDEATAARRQGDGAATAQAEGGADRD